MSMRRPSSLLSLALLALTGCTAVADLDSFESSPLCDFEMQLRNYGVHLDHRFEVRVVTDEGAEEPNRLSGRAILDPMGTENLDLRMPQVMDERPHRVDFFADANQNGTYDDPMTDHTWQVREACEGSPILFEHKFDFAPLPAPVEPGVDFEMTLDGMPAGVPFELRVVELGLDEEDDEALGRTVGLYRIPEIAADGVIDVSIGGIIRDDKKYIISFWADRTGDGDYDPPNLDDPEDPSTDEAWRLRGMGTEATGLTFTRIPEHADIGGILVDTSP